MSKVDALRAMREANLAKQKKAPQPKVVEPIEEVTDKPITKPKTKKTNVSKS